MLVAAILFMTLAFHPAKAPEPWGNSKPNPAQSTRKTESAPPEHAVSQQPDSAFTVEQVHASPCCYWVEQQKSENGSEGTLVWITGGLVVVGLLQAWLFGKQWSAFNRQNAHFAKSERAWLTAKVTDFDGESTVIRTPASGLVGLIHIAAPITNSGRTPAKVKYMRITRKLIPFPEGWGRPGQLPEVPVYDEPTPTMIVSGKDFIIAPNETKRFLYTLIWSHELREIQQRKISLYVYGEIEYLDTIEGKEHRTCFCEIYWVPIDAKEPEGFMFSVNLVPDTYICAT